MLAGPTVLENGRRLETTTLLITCQPYVVQARSAHQPEMVSMSRMVPGKRA